MTESWSSYWPFSDVFCGCRHMCSIIPRKISKTFVVEGFMKCILRNVLAGLLVCVLGSAIVWAQGGSTAQISGAVKDQSGALLPGAEVAATQTDTGLTRNVVTDETG